MTTRIKSSPALLALLFGCALETPRAVEVLAIGDTRDLSEREYLQHAFNDAACVCESLVLNGASYANNQLGLNSSYYVPDLLIRPEIGRCGDEPLMVAYANEHLQKDAPEFRESCGSTSRGEYLYSADEANPYGSYETNGCVNAESFGVGAKYSTGTGVLPGFCRADFNYCLAQQLAQQVDSQLHSPPDRTVRDSILKESRQRFQKAASEFALSLAGAAQCPAVGPAKRCVRFDNGYGRTAVSRMLDSIDQVGKLLADELESRVRRSHALLGTARETRDLWGPESPALDAAQLIMGSAPLEGDLTTTSPSGLEMPVFVQPRGGDIPYASTWVRDEGAHSALALLLEQKAMLPLITCQQYRFVSVNDTATEWVYRHLNDRLWHDVGPRTLDNGLSVDLRDAEPPILTEAQLNELLPANATRLELAAREVDSFYPAGSVPSEVLGVTKADVAQGLDLFGDVVALLDSEYTMKPAATLDNGCTANRVVFASEAAKGLDPRLAAASLSASTDTSFAPPTPGFVYCDAGQCQELNPGDDLGCWYEVSVPSYLDPEPKRADHAGAAWTMAALREQLFYLQEQRRARAQQNPNLPTSDWLLGTPELDASIELIDAYVGTRWTEMERLDESSLAWRVYDKELLDGEPVFLTNEEDAYCLTHGGRRRGHFEEDLAEPKETSCRQAALPTTELFPPVSGPYGMITGGYCPYRGDRTPRCYQLTGAGGPTTAVNSPPIYVLWKTGCDGSGLNCSYELVDVIRNRARHGAINAHGGRFGEMFANLLAKNPRNPAAPQQTLFDLPFDFVPPIEHELIDNGNEFEDSWSVYLKRAEEAAKEASDALAKVREFELETVQANQLSEAQRQSAVVAQEQAVSALCGGASSDASCSIQKQRATMTDLGLLDDVIPDEWKDDWKPYGGAGHPAIRGIAIPQESQYHSDFGYERYLPEHPPGNLGVFGVVACSEFAQTFVSHYKPPTPSCSAKERIRDVVRVRGPQACQFSDEVEHYMRQFWGAAIYCSHWAALDALQKLEFSSLPVPVVEAVQGKRDNTFADFGGEQRKVLLHAYEELRELHEEARNLNSVFASAKIHVDELAREAGDQASTSWERVHCAMKEALASVQQIAKGIARIARYDYMGGNDINAGLYRGYKIGHTCSEGDLQAQLTMMTALHDMILELDQVTSIQDDAARTLHALASIDEDLNSLRRKADMADKKRQLAQLVADSQNKATLPSWIALRGVEAERAKRLLRTAEQLAFVARRAVEFRLGTDLSSLTKPETFVDTPARWANDVFILDTQTIADDANGYRIRVAGEALEDYVHKLRTLVDGYAFGRRYAEGTDLAVVSVDQVAKDLYYAPVETVLEDGTSQVEMPHLAEATRPSDLPLAARMWFKCKAWDALLPGGRQGADLMSPDPEVPPCAGALGGVEYAKVDFFIDDTLEAFLGEDLAAGTFNFRIKQIAANVVGTGVVDCRNQPASCAGDKYVSYTLRQSGTVTLENYEGQLSVWPMEPGVIQQARALASERVITNPLSQADRQLLTDYFHREWFGRPLAGSFSMMIFDRPGLDWTQLEDIQVLLEYEYWTRQR